MKFFWIPIIPGLALSLLSSCTDNPRSNDYRSPSSGTGQGSPAGNSGSQQPPPQHPGYQSGKQGGQANPSGPQGQGAQGQGSVNGGSDGAQNSTIPRSNPKNRKKQQGNRPTDSTRPNP